MAKVAVFDKSGKEKESLDLPGDIFDGIVNQDVIHQAVVMYQASGRQGTVSTKNRGEVSGGSRKPFRQKGTGSARQGSMSSPLQKRGGITFGPKPRDFSYDLPKQIRAIALRESLKVKYQGKDIHVIDDIKESLPKTKDFVKMLENLSIKGKILALLDGSHETLTRSSKNISTVFLKRWQDVNALDVIHSKKILVTKTALKKLLERIQ